MNSLIFLPELDLKKKKNPCKKDQICGNQKQG